MKTITLNTFVLSLIVGFLISIDFAYAQSPQKFSYQAVVRDGNEELATNQNIGLQISILEDSENGSAVYVERHFPTTNANGLVSLEIGTGTVISGNFEAIEWGEHTYFVQTETDLDGGSNYSISGTSQLVSVPYSINAQSVNTINEGQIDVNHLSIEDAEEGDILRFNGTSWELVTEGFELVDANTLETDKNVDIDGELRNSNKTGDANLVPIAYGVIHQDVIQSGTGNFTLSQGSNFSGDYYDIEIDNENFTLFQNISVATPIQHGDIRITSSGGKMRIYTYDENGDADHLSFYFVVYKP